MAGLAGFKTRLGLAAGKYSLRTSSGERACPAFETTCKIPEARTNRQCLAS